MKLIITPEQEQLILLQRTGFKGKDTATCYADSLEQDYASICAHLPLKCKSILDIGCGVGGIDVMLNQHYKGNAKITLFDFNKVDDEIYYGYQNKTAAYNRINLAKEFLVMNEVDENNIIIKDALNGFPDGSFDLIISLISYGFHYPVLTYLDNVKKANFKAMILDIRKGTGQIEQLKENFKNVKIINEYQKYSRVLLK